MSVLSVTQDAMALLSLPKPVGLVASTDPTVTQILAVMQFSGDELAEISDWNNLKTEAQMTGDGVTSTFVIPADFDKWASDGAALFSSITPWTPINGPITDNDMVFLKTLQVAPLRPSWRIVGGVIEFFPVLALNEVITGEYRSSYWVLASDFITRKAKVTADDDNVLVPEKLLVRAIIWRWKMLKGLEYAEDFRSYETMKNRMLVNQHGPRIVSMVRGDNSGTDGTIGLITYR